MPLVADDVKRLARLSMLAVEATEAESLSSEMNAILGFFSSVKDYPSSRRNAQSGHAPREDGGCVRDEAEADSIVAEFPAGESRNLNVPRVL